MGTRRVREKGIDHAHVSTLHTTPDPACTGYRPRRVEEGRADARVPVHAPSAVNELRHGTCQCVCVCVCALYHTVTDLNLTILHELLPLLPSGMILLVPPMCPLKGKKHGTAQQEHTAEQTDRRVRYHHWKRLKNHRQTELNQEAEKHQVSLKHYCHYQAQERRSHYCQKLQIFWLLKI